MAKFIEIEAWIVVDADENYVVAPSPADAAERYGEEVGDSHDAPRRTICVKLKVPVPEVVQLAAEIPAETSDATLAVVQ